MNMDAKITQPQESLSESAFTPQDPVIAELANKTVMEFLRSPDYFIVQRAIVFLGAHTGRLRVEGMTNLRDVLDHLARIAQIAVDENQIAHHMAEAKEHLRRALMNPYHDEIQERIWQLEQTGRGYLVRSAIYKGMPSEQEFKLRLSKARKQLAEARLLKSDYTQVSRAAQILTNCLTELEALAISTRVGRPDTTITLALRVIVVLMAISLFLIVFFVTGFLWRLLFGL